MGPALARRVRCRDGCLHRRLRRSMHGRLGRGVYGRLRRCVYSRLRRGVHGRLSRGVHRCITSRAYCGFASRMRCGRAAASGHVLCRMPDVAGGAVLGLGYGRVDPAIWLPCYRARQR